MRCPACGNEVHREEAFCGQCGTPTAQQPYHQGMQASQSLQSPPQYAFSGPVQPSSSNQTPLVSPSYQQSDFYQNATEAVSVLPARQHYPTQSYQAGYPGNSAAPQYSHYYNSHVQGQQAFQSEQYVGPGYQQPVFSTGQTYAYGSRGKITPPPQKQQHGVLVVVICTCVVITLIAVIGVGILYLTRTHNNAKTSVAQPTVVATATPATITPTPMPSPTVGATPTLVPTPAPDANFTWCDQTCVMNGFLTEYPNGWQEGPATNASGVQFTHPTEQDMFTSLKALGATTSTAEQLLTSDFQTNFASKGTDVTPPGQPTTTTIGGETWITSTAYYQTTVRERLQIFAVVHQGKGYIIELQAPDTQFDATNTQFFVNIIGRFQFQQIPGQ